MQVPNGVCVLALIGTLASVPTAAQARCPVAPGAGVAVADIRGETRLAWIDARLSHGARSAKRWTWGWGIGIGAATVANLAAIPFVSHEDRIDWYVGAATTIVGIVPLLIAPLDVIGDARELRAQIATLPAGWDQRDSDNRDDDAGAEREGICALVADAELRLVRSAKNQADGQRWWLHVGNVALNVGVGLFLGIGYNHWGAGAFNAIGGSLIGEAIILTQPTETIADLRAYQRGDLGGERPVAALPTPLTIATATTTPWMLGYGVQF